MMRFGLVSIVILALSATGCAAREQGGVEGVAKADTQVDAQVDSRAEKSPSMDSQPEAPSDLADEDGKVTPPPGPSGTDGGDRGDVSGLVEDVRGDYYAPLGLKLPQPNASVAERFESYLKTSFDYLNASAKRLERQQGPSAAELRARATLAGTKLTTAERRCVAAYDRLYGGKPRLEVRIALGYDDYEGDDQVMDSATKLSLIEFLARPCERDKPQLRACGFTYDRADQSLSRTIDGPDGKPRVLRLVLHSSSASVSDGYNRLRAPDEQERLSAEGKAFFLDSFRVGDVVIYAGHSRDGGGPSFSPPRLVRDRYKACRAAKPDFLADRLEACVHDGLNVDYDWYHRHRVDERDMLKALAALPARLRPRLLVLASCYSESHFGGKLRQTAPDLPFFGTRSMLGSRQMVAMVLGTLDALVHQTCRRDLLVPLIEPSERDSEGKRLDGNPSITGFF